MGRNNILIVDFFISGHHTEYISHLADYLKDRQLNGKYIFVVHPHLKDEFNDIVAKCIDSDSIVFIGITEKELSECEKGGLIKRSFASLRLVKKYARFYNARHVCLLYFNLFQLALLFYRPNFTISGILFFQFYRMSTRNIKDWIKYYRKYLITKLYVNNSRIKRVFVLNDAKTVDFLNTTFKTTIFEVLPDPIPVLDPLNNFDIYTHYNIERHKKIFLHIGSISNRKGSLEFIKSSHFLSHGDQQNFVYLLVGKASDEQISKGINHIIQSTTNDTSVQIIWDNTFVSKSMMKSLFDQCHAIVIPYKNAEASSGILGHAAASQKLVITTGKGLLKDIVTEYNLGLLIEEAEPAYIANKIAESITHTMSVDGMKKLTNSSKVEYFASKISKNFE